LLKTVLFFLLKNAYMSKALSVMTFKFPIVVASLEELGQIVNKHTFTKTSINKVKIKISAIPEQESARLEQSTNKYLESCGCRQGMFAGIVLLVFGWFFRVEGGWLFCNVFTDMTIVFLTGAIAGKVLTYAVLRIKLAIQLRHAEYLSMHHNKITV
jgi:hypothetical protein